MEKILVSACLLGERVRYDGGGCTTVSPWLQRMQLQGRIVAFCPEVAGGLSVPRPAAELQHGDAFAVLEGQDRVVTKNKKDVTTAFLQGAERALQVCKDEGICMAILKDGSPSCGTSNIHDGSFTSTKVSGMGVTAAHLIQHGIHLSNEENLDTPKYSKKVVKP